MNLVFICQELKSSYKQLLRLRIFAFSPHFVCVWLIPYERNCWFAGEFHLQLQHRDTPSGFYKNF